MSSDPHCDRIAELFVQAKDRPLERRSDFLNGACVGDPPEVRQAVERLLAVDQRDWRPEPHRPAAAVRLNCPHCRSPIELVVDPEDEAVCPSCGSSFRLDADRTQTWSKDKLPRLGKFDLLARLGVGAFGAVYKAHDSELKRTVAIKIPRSGSLSGPEDEDRFLREARSAAQLRHSGIVPVFEVGRSAEFPYIVSELVEGITLADALTAKRLSFRETAELVEQVAEALDYSHRQGVVHRDLKPSNIMLTAEGTPRIMDFGLAKREAGEITMTIEGQVLGTPAYMSPEQAAGNAYAVDGRSDIYSLGVILYELLTGELPFRGNQRMLLHQVLHDEPRAPRKLNDRVPRDLETVCLKAMAKEPARRFQTAGQLAAELGRYLKGDPIHSRPLGRVEWAWRWSKQRRAVAGLLATVAALVLIGSITATSLAIWALHEKGRAEVEKRRAETQLLRAEWLLYASHAATAQREWETKSPLLAWQHLNSCRLDYRGWEHDYLYTTFNRALMSLKLEGHTGYVRSIAFSPNGHRVVSGSADGKLTLWDATNGQTLWTWSPKTETKESSVNCLAFAPDGRRIVSGSSDHTIRVWDATSGETTLILQGHTGGVNCVAFAPDGLQIASGGDDKTLRIWDATTGQAKLPLDGHGGSVACVAYGRTEKELFSVAAGAIRSWDAATGHNTLTFPAKVNCLAVSSDGKWIVGGGSENLELFEAHTGRSRLLGRPPGVTSVAISSDNQRIATSHFDPMIRIWDVSTGEETTPLIGHTGICLSVAFSPDGRRLASGGSDATVKVWSAANSESPPKLRGFRAQFSPDAQQIVGVSPDNTIKVWQVSSGAEVCSFSGQSRDVTSVQFTSNGERIVSVSNRQEATVWDVSTGSAVRRMSGDVVGVGSNADRVVIREGDSLMVWDVMADNEVSWRDVSMATSDHLLVNTNGTRVVGVADSVISTTSRISVWDADSGTVLLVVPNVARDVDGLGNIKEAVFAVSPAGDQCAVCSMSGTVQVWDVATETERLSIRAGPVTRLAFSPDGELIADAGRDGTIRAWDTGTGQEVLVLRGHADRVTGVAFSPDRMRIASVSQDRSLTIWTTTAGQATLTLKGHAEALVDVAFSPDGKLVLSGDRGGNIRLWNGSQTMPHYVPAGVASANPKASSVTTGIVSDGNR